MTTNLNEYSKSELAYRELARRELARRSMLAFTLYTFPEFEVSWHHALICEYLDKWVDGKITRLLIETPPRHGKSELVSRRLPAYVLGRYPDARFIGASYSASLASSFNRDVQRIIDSERYHHLFPDTQLFGKNIRTQAQGTWLRNSEIFEIVHHAGYYKNAGVGGSLTGFGFDFGSIDDPIKGAKEANSPTIRKSIHAWYDSDFWTRQQPGARILVTNTRWHQDDLTGHIIETGEADGGEGFIRLTLPAIMEDLRTKHPEDPRNLGEALWADWFDIEWLEKARAQNQYTFSALYQQTPTPVGDTVFDVEQLKANTIDMPFETIRQVRFYDLAVTMRRYSDYTVAILMGVSEDNLYIILDMYRVQKRLPDIENDIVRNAQLDGKTVPIQLEGEKAGIIQLDYLVRRKELQGYIINKKPPIGDKLTRSEGFATQVNNGRVYMLRASWNKALLDEFASFPLGSHDDIVDACSGAFNDLVNIPITEFFTF